MRSFAKLFTRLPWPFFIMAIALWLRWTNLDNRLYFIYDQGRDMVAISAIAAGDLTLVGPTTGLQGLFLGPLWYYLGLPGFVISNGNPWLQAYWYIAWGCLFIPLTYLISTQLFSRRHNRLLILAALTLCPGAIIAGVFIWNPLISVPLMALAWLGLGQAHKSRWWLLVGFGALALTLQSEFAYMVFILPIMWLLIGWLSIPNNPLSKTTQNLITNWWQQLFRNKLNYFLSTSAVFATLLPQALFEIRHNFIMSRSLISGLADASNQASWWWLLRHRPLQIMHALGEAIVGSGSSWQTLAGGAALLFALFGCYIAWRWQWQNANQQRFWQVGSILFLAPLVGMSIWRGNHGNFFSYYLTPHFIFLLPLAFLGWKNIVTLFASKLIHKWPVFFSKIYYLQTIIGIATLVVWLTLAKPYFHYGVFFVTNNAGLMAMETAIAQLYNWRSQFNNQGAIRFFTPNVFTEHYDYLSYQQANKLGIDPAPTVRIKDEPIFVLQEPAGYQETYAAGWLKDSTENMYLVEEMQVGVLKLSIWRDIIP